MLAVLWRYQDGLMFAGWLQLELDICLGQGLSVSYARWQSASFVNLETKTVLLEYYVKKNYN